MVSFTGCCIFSVTYYIYLHLIYAKMPYSSLKKNFAKIIKTLIFYSLITVPNKKYKYLYLIYDTWYTMRWFFPLNHKFNLRIGLARHHFFYTQRHQKSSENRRKKERTVAQFWNWNHTDTFSLNKKEHSKFRHFHNH